MFLNSLNEKQKNFFIELAIKAAESNGIVALEQKNMLKCFAMEMNITPKYSTDNDTETIIRNLIDISTEKELKIILFEILGIIVSDAVFDEQEKEFVKHMVERCNINPNLVDEMVNLLYEYTAVYQNMVNLVLQ